MIIAYNRGNHYLQIFGTQSDNNYNNYDNTILSRDADIIIYYLIMC